MLMSNDWEKRTPKTLLAEVLGRDLHELQEGELLTFMIRNDYRISAKTANSVFFSVISTTVKDEVPNG